MGIDYEEKTFYDIIEKSRHNRRILSEGCALIYLYITSVFKFFINRHFYL